MSKSILHDAKADAVLDRLERLNARQKNRILRHVIPRWIGHRLRGTAYEDMDPQFFRDKLVALDPDKCRLLYLLCRSLRARTVVEVGTSFGVSTIYLAAAIRDNTRDGEPAGIVIGTELEPAKVTAARANLAEAGLDAFADIREGDALHTLKEIDQPIDLVLLDTWTPLARPAIELLAPRMREGAIVVCDYVTQAAREYADYTNFVRSPTNGFLSITIPYDGGLEFSVRSTGVKVRS